MAKKDQETITRVIAKLNAGRPRKDDGGTFELTRSTETVLSKIRYSLKSGIASFDAICGGVPFGRVTEVYGLEGCGKSAMAQRLAIMAQKGEIYERTGNEWSRVVEPEVTILYIDNEQSIDADSRTTIDGTELDVILARCDTVDQLFKMVELTVKEVGAIEKETKVPQFVVIVVDTIAGTSSKEEMTQDWGKDDFNRQAKFLSKGFRRLTRTINRHNVAMICINQVRDSFKQKVGYSTGPTDEDFSTFGGKALKFYSSLRVFMHAINKKYQFRKGTRFSQGLLIDFQTTKNRIKKPYRNGRMVLLFEGGLSNDFSILETLITYKFAVVKETGEGIQFRLKANGISTEGFDMKPRQQNPEIGARVEWPAFYAAHKVELDQLWDKAVAYAFANEGVGAPQLEGEDGELDDEEFMDDDEGFDEP